MFYKVSANGNDFILVEAGSGFQLDDYRDIYPDVDGLILLSPSKVCDSNFRIYNKDSSRAKICGNGLLAAACYLRRIKKIEKDSYTFLTDSGFFTAEASGENYSALFPDPLVLSLTETSGVIDTGNLHLISLRSPLDPDELIAQATLMQNQFNLHQLQKKDDNFYLMISLERGVGFTKCCGSGSVAAFKYLEAAGKLEGQLYLQTLGGLVRLRREEEQIRYTGHARIIYRGERCEEDLC